MLMPAVGGSLSTALSNAARWAVLDRFTVAANPADPGNVDKNLGAEQVHCFRWGVISRLTSGVHGYMPGESADVGALLHQRNDFHNPTIRGKSLPDSRCRHLWLVTGYPIKGKLVDDRALGRDGSESEGIVTDP